MPTLTGPFAMDHAGDPGGDAAALDIGGLCKSFAAIPVLRGVSLAVRAGEVHALLGENGAGKSTLIRCCAGALRPDAGVIRIAGVAATFAGPADALRAGVRVIHQERSLVPYFDVVETVFLGRRQPRRLLRLDRAAMRAAVAAVADRLAPGLPLDVPVARLSPGQQQMAEILRAFLGRARIVFFDEPTAALGEAEARLLFDAIRRLRDEGVAVVYVSHRLEEVLALCDRATVLRDGAVAGGGRCAELDVSTIVQMMSGAHAAAPAARAAPGGGLLRLVEWNVGVRCGEIVGLYGLLGAGRSRSLRALFGAGGRLQATLRGIPYAPRTPRAAIAASVVLVPEDRAAQGLMLRQPVRVNATLPLLRRFRRRGWLPLPAGGRERAFTLSLRRLVGLRLADPEQRAGTLSGGNQQKLLLGRWLAQTNALWLLDEPTRGIDVAAKAELHAEIRALAAAGAAVLLATSDLGELLALSDRVVVLRAGRVAAAFAPGAATGPAVLAASLGQ